MAAEIKIGANVYRCEKLPASEALKLFMRVTRFFTAAPAMMASVATGSADKQAMSAFVTIALSDASNPDETHDLLVDLAQMCTIKGEACIVGVKPADLQELIQVAWFAMEVNFKDFLAASLADG